MTAKNSHPIFRNEAQDSIFRRKKKPTSVYFIQSSKLKRLRAQVNRAQVLAGLGGQLGCQQLTLCQRERTGDGCDVDNGYSFPKLTDNFHFDKAPKSFRVGKRYSNSTVP
ncbi:hypothetical protein E5288_WYG009707 [Bos mutus]|uniref:Uncharacterized protein n=1 Tax=Bos mutus TaxID=72004 RepID=A0A6B0QZF7_9CETA|nr:hypothetical protein [Bos mutus]